MLSRPVTGLRASLRNREFLAAAAGAALLAGLGGPAEAYPFDLQPRAAAQPEAIRPALTRPARAVVPREKVAPKEKEAADELAAKTKGVLTVVVSLDKQHLTLYSDGHPVAHTKVSTGTASHPTPTGVFSVIQKDRWHRSNIYGNAPMFFMQRITWSGVAMHQGFVTGQPASHGCIRLPEAFAKQLWPTTKLGVRVIVARSDVAPVPIAHDRLFTIKLPPEPKAEPEVAATDKPAEGALEVAQLADAKPTATDAAPPPSTVA